MSQNKGVHPSGWAGLVTVSQSPFLEEASPLCSSLIWWPNLGTERTETQH